MPVRAGVGAAWRRRRQHAADRHASRGCSMHDRDLRVVIVSPLVNDPAFRARGRAPARDASRICRRIGRQGLEARLLALMQAGYLESGDHRVGAHPPRSKRKPTARSAGLARSSCWRGWWRRRWRSATAATTSSDRLVSHPWAEALFDRHRPAMLRHVESGADPVRSAAAADRGPPQGLDRWPSTRAGTTSRTSCCRFAASTASIVWNDLMKQQAIELHGYDRRRDPRRRHAAVGSLLPRRRDDLARGVLPARRRRPGTHADHADDDAARALPASRSRVARAGRGDSQRPIPEAGAGAGAPPSARRATALRRVRVHARR